MNLCDKIKPETIIDWTSDDDCDSFFVPQDPRDLDYYDVYLDERTSSPILKLELPVPAAQCESVISEEMLWMDDVLVEEECLLEFD